jgi:hypothetical protein
MSPPLPTEAAFDAHMATIDAIVAARPVLDFTLPCMDGPQNASDDPDAAPNTSMTGEFFNELEHGWKVMLERASGEQRERFDVGHSPVAGDPTPAWWARRVADARRANHRWIETLRGTGAQGASGLVFTRTGIVLNGERLREIGADTEAVRRATVAGGGFVIFDEQGLAHFAADGTARRCACCAAGAFAPPAASPAPAESTPTPAASPAPAKSYECGACGAGGADLRCSRCKQVHYCSVACQRVGWKAHQSACTPCDAAAATPAPSKEHPDEGKIVDGRVMVNGEWFPVQLAVQLLGPYDGYF